MVIVKVDRRSRLQEQSEMTFHVFYFSSTELQCSLIQCKMIVCNVLNLCVFVYRTRAAPCQ